jgi:hypothetical protein
VFANSQSKDQGEYRRPLTSAKSVTDEFDSRRTTLYSSESLELENLRLEKPLHSVSPSMLILSTLC